jgi:hypothetical protein
MKITTDRCILLPTGDGMCIALLNVDALYDIHIDLALHILEHIRAENSATEDPQRKFEVRVGINANVDNVITDVNGSLNVAGAGINFAERFMSMADGGQILVGQAVYESIQHRERYMNAFRAYRGVVKHNLSVPVYQYVGGEHPGLNTCPPRQFVPQPAADLLFSPVVAYYVAHAVRNHDLFVTSFDRPLGHYWAIILLWSLANDSLGHAQASPVNPYRPHTWGAGKVSVNEQLEYYQQQDFWVCYNLCDFILEKHLNQHEHCFSNEPGKWQFVLVNQAGKDKLKQEWPGIWRDFEFESMM